MHFNLTPEQAAFQQAARGFAREKVAPRAAAIHERDEFPVDLVKEAGAHGLMGVTIPKEWGGAGADCVSYVLALEEVAHASATLAVILVVNNSLVVEPLLRFGSEDQKRRWLPRLARGEQVGAFALSEEEAGTDAANQQTTAARLPGGGFRLAGSSARAARDSRSRAGRSTARASGSPRRRSASARWRSTRQGRTRSAATPSASRSRPTRRSSSCWRTRRPNSMPRGC
jgi:alkylation response protein AidB-like acyl-CoA dehydrogenase